MPFERSSLSAFPRPQTSFIGRSTETASIHALLARPGVRLVTLTGPGGVGKTRLALHAALTAPGFEDGRWFVDLSGINDPALVLPQIARALGLEQHAGIAARDQLIELLDGRNILLVLDNFEHLLGGATVLSQLISQASRFQLLVTSRAPLNLANEHLLPVGALDIRADGSDSGHGDAVELFLQRSRAIRAGYEPGPADLEAIAAICAELSGLPLAIELAAARTRVMAPQALLGRLAQPLRILAAGPHDAPERHRSMREAIDWSYRLLSPQQRDLLRAMGVFAGSVPLDGLESVVSAAGIVAPEQTIELVEQLTDASMIEALDGDPAEPRFQMSAPVREFVWDEMIASGELVALRNRHADWVAALSEQERRLYNGPREHLANKRLRTELDNIRAAIEWSLQHGDRSRAALIVANLWAFWSFGGHANDGRLWTERILRDGAGHPLDPELECRMQLTGGVVAWTHGESDLVLARYQRGLAMARELGDRPREADALVWISQAEWYAGDYRAMRRAAQDALAIPQRMPAAAALSHTLTGIAEMRLGDLDTARRELETARAQHDAIGFTRGSIWTSQLLADLAQLRGDFAEAARDHRRSLQLSLDTDNVWAIFESHSGLIRLTMQLGWTNEAIELLAAAELLLVIASIRPREGGWLTDADRAALKAAIDPADLERLAQNAAARSLPQLVARATEIARSIESGPHPKPRRVVRRNTAAAAFDLSDREQETLALLVQGKTDRQIAEALDVSHGTARTHVAHVLQKLDARNRAVAVRKALEHELV